MRYLTKNMTKKIAVVGCKHTTKDLILGLERYGIKVDHCITISPKKGREQKVSGYMDLKPFLKSKSSPFTIAKSYNLKNEEDKKILLALKLDMLLVMGWQRLIPDWLLKSLSIGAFGMHGSSKPLPFGRGRSPINWSLIQDKKVFYTHLFQYLPGVDNGPIVGIQKFDINPYDNCLTLHFKNTVSMIRLCGKYIPSLLDGNVKLVPQPDKEATYYPKRSEQDGIIYWEGSSEEINNLVRGITKPFPGAFSFLNNNPREKIYIWKAQPFDTKIDYNDGKPGEIVEVFYNGMFVVKTNDSTLLITESEGYKFTENDVGKFLGHLNLPRKEWKNLPKYLKEINQSKKLNER